MAEFFEIDFDLEDLDYEDLTREVCGGFSEVDTDQEAQTYYWIEQIVSNLLGNQENHGYREGSGFLRIESIENSVSVKIRAVSDKSKLDNLLENRIEKFGFFKTEDWSAFSATNPFLMETSSHSSGTGTFQAFRMAKRLKEPQWSSPPIIFKLGPVDEEGNRAYELTLGHRQLDENGQDHVFEAADAYEMQDVFNSVDYHGRVSMAHHIGGADLD